MRLRFQGRTNGIDSGKNSKLLITFLQIGQKPTGNVVKLFAMTLRQSTALTIIWAISTISCVPPGRTFIHLTI